MPEFVWALRNERNIALHSERRANCISNAREMRGPWANGGLPAGWLLFEIHFRGAMHPLQGTACDVAASSWAHVTVVRSISLYGLSDVRLTFHDGKPLASSVSKAVL
jgi:hypothetical protein